MTATSGSQSRMTRETSSEKAAMPAPSHRKIRSCFVGIPHSTTSRTVPIAQAMGAPIRSCLRRSTREH